MRCGRRERGQVIFEIGARCRGSRCRGRRGVQRVRDRRAVGAPGEIDRLADRDRSQPCGRFSRRLAAMEGDRRGKEGFLQRSSAVPRSRTWADCTRRWRDRACGPSLGRPGCWSPRGRFSVSDPKDAPRPRAVSALKGPRRSERREEATLVDGLDGARVREAHVHRGAEGVARDGRDELLFEQRGRQIGSRS